MTTTQTTHAWVIDGEIECTGTLVDYAQAYANAAHSSMDITLPLGVTKFSTGYNEDDWAYVEFTYGDSTATARIDGLA